MKIVAGLMAVCGSWAAGAQTVSRDGEAEPVRREEIVVTAARTVLPANALPLTVDIIDRETLSRQIVVSGSVVDAISALLPAFSPTREKISGFGETLRGRSPLYAINGIPQTTPIRDGARDGYTIDPFFIDRVEVIYGSNALQGIGGTGGVVNQVTVHAPAQEGVTGRTLLQGDAGETANGVAGLIGLFFVVTGAVLWWRVRKRFSLRLWPAKMTPGAIVQHHRDIGIVTAPLLFLSLLTGVMMVLPVVGQWLLSPMGREEKARVPVVPVGHALRGPIDLGALIAVARTRFPDAEPRRLTWPRKPDAPIVLRVRQGFEWTPNGRTFLYFDPATLAVLGEADPAKAGAAAWLREKLYPVHAAKTGGIGWKLAMTVSGVTLMLLGSLAVYGFWRTRWMVRGAARRKRLS